MLLDFQADLAVGSTTLELAIESELAAPAYAGLQVSEQGGKVTVDTGVAQFRVPCGGRFPFDDVVAGGEAVIDPDHTSLSVEDGSGRAHPVRITQVAIEESGPLRAVVLLTGTVGHEGKRPLVDLFARLHFFAGLPTVRVALTLRNSRRARHRDGFWDLGDPGSVYLKDVSLRVTLRSSKQDSLIYCSPDLDAPAELCDGSVDIYQDSSGGQNWRSSNHVNRHRTVPTAFRGYRLQAGRAERVGLRATPVVSLQRGVAELTVAMPQFWQNFPKAIAGSPESIVLRLFPGQFADVHELQGGEQKTHTFVVAFGRDRVTDLPLAWCRSPLLARADPRWYCSTGAVPYLTPAASDPNTGYLELVQAAIEGHDTFVRKREVIDEYGWRHFGDIYGDHEAVRHREATPLVSHYNNQYDPVAGFACQFLRSGDPRWWTQMNELAEHVVDIDIYHADRDKAAYNHGLFWHTVHYTDADTATHRSYPRSAKAGGGGPNSGHNYTTGLMLHYFLTGNSQSRQSALDLAQFVIDMDDGRKTVFRWLDRGHTGVATASGSVHYHGPGRAGANSLNALVDGHRVSGTPEFKVKAEQLIRRCIHPADDLAARNLLDAELKWFYTMFLQALGKYLAYKAECGELDAMYAYARASLLHYARWMAAHEYPYLEKPEILEFPTETWAAQDMRKSDVLNFAAKHSAGEERARFRERAEFFFQYSTRTLSAMKTRTLARPVVILLSSGLMHSYFQQYPGVAAPVAMNAPAAFGSPELFVPQKVRAKRRFALLLASLALLVVGAAVYLAR